MILYHGTSKENAEYIKRNGFSSEYAGKNLGSTYGKAIYFTNCNKTAKYYAGINGIVLTIDVKNVNHLKLDNDFNYNSYDEKHIRKIRSIIMYLVFNSNKNCLLNYNENEYIFFNRFKYTLIL
jgi:hypothetical protein